MPDRTEARQHPAPFLRAELRDDGDKLGVRDSAMRGIRQVVDISDWREKDMPAI